MGPITMLALALSGTQNNKTPTNLTQPDLIRASHDLGKGVTWSGPNSRLIGGRWK